jgi:hypothetical protein
LAIAEVLPLGETRLVTLRSLLLISDSMFLLSVWLTLIQEHRFSML